MEEITFDEHRALMASIDKEQQALSERRDRAIKDYIEANRPFNIGDAVEVVNISLPLRPKEYGIVYDFRIAPNGLVSPLLYKIKKDGTASKNKIHIYSYTAYDFNPYDIERGLHKC